MVINPVIAIFVHGGKFFDASVSILLFKFLTFTIIIKIEIYNAYLV